MARTQEQISALRKEIAQVPWFWHSIDLGDGVVLPGRKGDLALMEADWKSLELPDLRGKSVLDIGAFDGYYSFKAEQAGAARVVSLDHFAWEVAEIGAGKGYEIAHRELNSKCERLHADFMDMDLEPLIGQFDVVLYLGILYHMENPLLAMRRVHDVTKDLAVIETESAEQRGVLRRPVAEFFPSTELNNDNTNWWSPNRTALRGLCAAAGFTRVETKKDTGSHIRAAILGVHRYRTLLHARR